MKVSIKPCAARGTVNAPPSKSMAHRMLICAGLSEGESEISGVALSQDVRATIACLKALGAKITMEGDTVHVVGTDVKKTPACVLPCNESGSTLRFFLPLCLLSGEEKRLVGSQRLLQRPQEIYRQLCVERGISFVQGEEEIAVKGCLTPGEFHMDGGVSSQFFSGMLFALPLLDGDSVLVIENGLQSRPYLELTRAALAASGVHTQWQGENRLFIPGCQRYHAIRGAVEGDWSNAAFLEALNLVGGDVKVTGLTEDSGQGDRIFRQYFELLRTGGEEEMNLLDCPDLAPILFAMAAYFGKGRFTGTMRLKWKESDRIAAMREELSAFGAEVKDLGDAVEVIGPCHAPNRVLNGHNDHRVVMSLAVLATRFGGEICGAEAVKKSMPDFFDILNSLSAEVISDAGEY